MSAPRDTRGRYAPDDAFRALRAIKAAQLQAELRAARPPAPSPEIDALLYSAVASALFPTEQRVAA